MILKATKHCTTINLGTFKADEGEIYKAGMSFQEVFFPQSVVVSTFKRNVSNAKDRIGCFQQDNVYIQKINLFYLHSGETVVTRKSPFLTIY